jgi:hypothetical protein
MGQAQVLQQELLQLDIVRKTRLLRAHDVVRLVRHQLVLGRETQLLGRGGEKDALLVDDVVSMLFEPQHRPGVVHAARVPED